MMSSAPAPIPFVLPQVEPDDGLMDALRAVLESGRLSNQGPHVLELERLLVGRCGAYALATSSGSAALTLALLALDLPPGRAVLPSFTFVATLGAARLAGLDPVLCDVEPHTWTLDPAGLARVLASTPDVRVVVPVSAYGVPPNLAAIGSLCAARGIPILVDDAHGLGTADRRPHPPPAARAYSLHATKIVPAGEGGALLIGDPALAARARRLRNHGIGATADDTGPGINAKLDELSAAIAVHVLARLDAVIARRTAYAERLRAALGAHGWQVQQVPPGVSPNWQNLAAMLPGVEADRTVAAFAAEGVEVRRYFGPPLHRLPGLSTPLPVTERLGHSLVCLPLHSRMDAATLTRIERAIARATGQLVP